MFAGNHGLDHLIAIVDYNKLQVDGSLEEVNSPCPIADKFEAFKWEVLTIDGNDVEQVADALPEGTVYVTLTRHPEHDGWRSITVEGGAAQ